MEENKNQSKLFKDSEFENLDWLNKTIEPVVFSVATLYSSFPMEAFIPMDEVAAIVAKSASPKSASTIELVHWIAKKNSINISVEHLVLFRHLFTIHYSEIQPFHLKDISSLSLRITKNSEQLSDELIKTITQNACEDIFRYGNRDKYNLTRCKEIMSLMGCEDPNSKSIWSKKRLLIDTWKNIIQDDLWRIRNMDLIIKAAKWIVDYLETGNLAALSNFTKLKCLTHKGNPIYSIEETI